MKLHSLMLAVLVSAGLVACSDEAQKETQEAASAVATDVKETTGHAVEKTDNALDKAGHEIAEAGEKVVEGTKDLAQEAGKALETAGEKVDAALENAGNAMSNTAEEVDSKVDTAAEKVENATNHAMAEVKTDTKEKGFDHAVEMAQKETTVTGAQADAHLNSANTAVVENNLATDANQNEATLKQEAEAIIKKADSAVK